MGAETIEGAFSAVWEKRAAALGSSVSRDSASTLAREALADAKLAGTKLLDSSAARHALHNGLDSIIEAVPRMIEAVACSAGVVDDPAASKADGSTKNALQMAIFYVCSRSSFWSRLWFLPLFRERRKR